MSSIRSNYKNRRRRSSSRNAAALPPLSVVTARVSTSPHPSSAATGTTTTAAASVPPPPSKKAAASKSLLLTLSEACRKHLTSTHASDKQLLCVPELDQVPKNCRDSLEKLWRIVPKVEASYRKATLNDIRHMCDFYNDALAGGFCPHAPHLFMVLSKMLPRVHFLFQHLASQALIHETTSSPHGQADLSNSTFWYMCKTIARFLTAVPDSTLQISLLVDLIYMAKDLSVLYESKLLETNSAYEQEPRKMELVLFEETIAAAKDLYELTVTIPNVETLLSLQLATLSVVENVVQIQKERRLSDTLAVYLEEKDPSCLLVANPGMYFSGIIHTENMQTLLSSVRQVLLTPISKSSAFSYGQHALVLNAKLTASRVLAQLQADLHLSEDNAMATLQDVVLLAARAADAHLRMVATTGIAFEVLSSSLANLLYTLVLVPLPARGSGGHEMTTLVFQKTVFGVLCGCFQYFAPTVGPPELKFCDKDPKRKLEGTILDAIRAAMRNFCEVGVVGVAATFQMTQSMFTEDAIEGLFRALGDHSLSLSAVKVLVDLLGAGCTQRSYLPDLEKIATLCLLSCSDKSEEELSAGSKRQSSMVLLASAVVAAPKRRKTLGQWVPSRAFHFFDEEFLKFLCLAMESKVDILDFAKHKSGIGSRGLWGPIVRKLVYLSSTVHLLLSLDDDTFLESKHSSNYPSIIRFLRDCVVCLTTIGDTLHAALRLSNIEASCISCAEIVVLCGAELDKRGTRFMQSSLSENLSSLLACSKSIFEALWQRNFSTEMPFRPLSEYIQKSLEAKNDSIRGRLFDRSFFLTERFSSGGRSAIPCWSFLQWTPVSAADGEQENRLKLAAALRADSIVDLNGQVSLEKRCLDLVKDANRSDPDSCTRLIHWQSTAWLLLRVASSDLRPMILTYADGKRLVSFLIDVSFADPDPRIREYASRELGNALSTERWMALMISMSDDNEWRRLKRQESPAAVRQIRHQVTGRFFEMIDQLMQQLVLATAPAANDTSQARKCDASRAAGFGRSSARALSSICEAASSCEPPCIIIFEQAAIRLVRMCTRFGAQEQIISTGLGFAEMSRLSLNEQSSQVFLDERASKFVPLMFRDILGPRSSLLPLKTKGKSEVTTSAPQIERLFGSVSVIFQTLFLQERSHTSIADQNFTEDASLERCLEHFLPLVIAQLVVEKAYASLLLMTGYKLFLLGQKRSGLKSRKRSGTSSLALDSGTGSILGGSNFFLQCQSTARQWSRNLQDQTRQLCLAPGLIEQIIPLVFMRSGSSELTFFTQDVLQNRVTMKQLVTSREMLTLKFFVLELGRNPDERRLVVEAMQKAAEARSAEADTSGAAEYCCANDNRGKQFLDSWVTSHFMYLLVNAVQYKWSSKPVTLKAQALLSLLSILDFLKALEASQYLPQIMATVNAALAMDYIGIDENISIEHARLHLLAVRVLARFIEIVATVQWEIIGQNLTTIVVSLVPVVSHPSESRYQTVAAIAKQCQDHAVCMLQWLTDGELGKNLKKSFAAIPFLPPCSALDPIRSSLKLLGVNFANLQVVSQGTQQETASRSAASDAGSASVDSRAASINASRQAALRSRLETVCSLLGNENAAVRRVVIEHLSALLRANRDLFHALVENEAATSTTRWFTTTYRDKHGVSRGAVTEMIDKLLSRCVYENDPEARVLLASCLGEVGAIDPNRLEDEKPFFMGENSSRRQPRSPPWHSTSSKFGLSLITNHLVGALKAAPTSSDQHKIAFSIQQLLSFLDEQFRMEEDTKIDLTAIDSRTESSRFDLNGKPTKPRMIASLEVKLKEAGVFDVVEQFWFSEFHEAENNPPRQPPFFRSAYTFFGWLSNWCRHMVHRTATTSQNDWSNLFNSCRTALRTEAGQEVAERLLPLLILDRICYGNGFDQKTLLTEIQDVLSFVDRTTEISEMAHVDRRRAVSTVFSVLDTLDIWAKPEIDGKFAARLSKIRAAQRDNKKIDTRLIDKISSSCPFKFSECRMRIEELLSKIPLSLRAKAAANVEMHACALRFLEMASRAAMSNVVFAKDPTYVHRKPTRSRAAGTVEEPDASLMKDVLASLNDYETMKSVGDDEVWAAPFSRVLDSIRQKEALHDWFGALHDYESAQQLTHDDPSLQLGALKCLLKLGHFESVLQQVEKFGGVKESHAKALAIEASWRLGRWDSLSQLVETSSDSFDFEGAYQLHLGAAMLHVQNKNASGVDSSLKNAKSAVMQGLSSVARESYSRSYDHIVRLQALREVEDAIDIVCSHDPTRLGDITKETGLGWDRRVDFLSPSATTSVIDIRLAIARLARDRAFEAELFLRIGKRGRKSGMHGNALSSFAQAEAAISSIEPEQKAFLKSSLLLQTAKSKHDCGESSIALRMLGQEDIETMAALDDQELLVRSSRRVVDVLGVKNHGMNQEKAMNIFVRSALQSTRWMVEGGLKDSGEIIARFRILHRIAPRFEKAHFQFAKYVDSLLRARIMAIQGRSRDITWTDDDLHRNYTISRDDTCQRYVLLAIQHYLETVQLDMKLDKYVYQALPRLLSLWFDFSSIDFEVTNNQRAVGLVLSASQTTSDEKLKQCLVKNQNKVNQFMAGACRKISTQALFTVMPQLISRIVHNDDDTATIVQHMLRRVLTRYPAQAMWPLAWVRHSRDTQRQKIGNEIFHQATQVLKASEKTEHMQKLLVSSKTLLDYLYNLAKKEVPDKTRESVTIRPLSGEVDLCEFVPPIQAALSISLASGDSSITREAFPRYVPRMRAFSRTLTLMVSKARPKKLKAFMVSAESAVDLRRNGTSRDKKDRDIGELHFLIKQEVKGDLRKDARVQDMNNVVNRLMASSSDSSRMSTPSRILSVRTFSVTCLSEDTGILEWVPSTASLRKIVEKTHNPQADELSGKRTGKRIGNFADPHLRLKFEKGCQDTFFVSGNLTKAAALFETEVLRSYPPILFWWFVQNFMDPHAWYEARTRFTLSAAAWSAIGHCIGLGDRHSENLLLDVTTGECVHVDFDCIFDKGLGLPKPEVVPFRLTQNMVDAFGPTGADGVFTCNLISAMGCLRRNRDTLLSVLEPFVKDPVINWKKSRSQQRGRASDPTAEAKRKISVIDERLRGVYNLSNPNRRKVRRTDMSENQQDDDWTTQNLPLSVEGQVQKMIAEATSNENLVQLFVGWMPWI